MDFIASVNHLWRAKEYPPLRTLVSFDVRGKRQWVVRVYGITNRGGVTYWADHAIPSELMEFTRRCMTKLDFMLQYKDCVKFVYFNNDLTVVIDRDIVTIPAYNNDYPKHDTVKVAQPVVHTSGIVPETPGLLLVHPSWGGSPKVLATTTGDPLPVTF